MEVSFVYKIGDVDVKGTFKTDKENGERFKNSKNKEEILKEIILKNIKIISCSIR